MLEIEIIKGPTPDYNYPNIHEDEPIITSPNIFDNEYFDTPIYGNDIVTYPQLHSSIDTADDRFKREAEANLKRNTGNTTTTSDNAPVFGGGGGGGGSVALAPQNVTLTPRDLSQRTPSGTMYAPDLSAYNDSSLFNYTGPGGLSEYIYGQNLPYQGADYSIWGTPADMVNPYYTGQFATEQAAGVADGAISLPPIDLPAGVAPTNNNPNIGTSTTNFDPYKGEDILNKNVTKTTFPSPLGANPTLAERQRAQIGAEKYDAMVAQADAWDKQMREGQLGNIPEGLLDATDVIEDSVFADDTSPFTTDATYTTDYGPIAQAKADQLMASLTKEELRDGLFLEPQLEIVDGKVVGKMGIPDVFLQDKSRIPSEADYSFDDSNLFNADETLSQSEMSEQDLYMGNDGNYYKTYDDLGLYPVTPQPKLGPIEEPLNSIYDRIAESLNSAKFDNQYADTLNYTTEQIQARDAVIEKQEKAVQAKAREVEKQVNEARAQVKDVARKPVYTAPKSSMGAGSRWRPSWTGGL